MRMHQCIGTVFGYNPHHFLRDLIFNLSPLLSNARCLPILCANVSGARCERSALIITVEKTHFKREAMSFFPPTLHKVHSCEIFGMPSFMCPCSDPSERWAASLRNLIVMIGGVGVGGNKLEHKTSKLLYMFEVLSTIYAMMVNTVALFALHV